VHLSAVDVKKSHLRRERQFTGVPLWCRTLRVFARGRLVCHERACRPRLRAVRARSPRPARYTEHRARTRGTRWSWRWSRAVPKGRGPTAHSGGTLGCDVNAPEPSSRAREPRAPRNVPGESGKVGRSRPRERRAVGNRLRIVSRSTPTPKAAGSAEATPRDRCRSGAENGLRLTCKADQSRGGRRPRRD